MKKICFLIISLFIFVSLVGCATAYATNGSKNESMFVIVEESHSWRIVYHKDTKVMYATSKSGSDCGSFTHLVNPDGTPMLWEE